MKLFAILICFALQRYFGLSNNKGLLWINPYVQNGSGFLSKLGLNSPILMVILLVIPIAIVIAGVDYLLQDIWFNFLAFLFNIIVLFFCLNSQPLRRVLADYLNACERGDAQATFNYGTQFLKDDSVSDLVLLIRAVTRKIFFCADFYIFSVLFWYILTGVVGASIYAFITYLAANVFLQQPSLAKAANQLQEILDWLPQRLTAASYALMGHFGSAIQYLRKHLFDGLQESRGLAAEVGITALEIDPTQLTLADIQENKKALVLVDRTLVLWIVVIAVFTLVAWVS